MQDFSVEGGPPNVWGGPMFEGRSDILLLGKALKFRVIFQKYGLKLIKILKLSRKFEKNANFSEFFNFQEGDYGEK